MNAAHAIDVSPVVRRDDYGPRLLGDAFHAELRNVWAARRHHDRVERRRSSRFFVIQGENA